MRNIFLTVKDSKQSVSKGNFDKDCLLHLIKLTNNFSVDFKEKNLFSQMKASNAFIWKQLSGVYINLLEVLQTTN